MFGLLSYGSEWIIYSAVACTVYSNCSKLLVNLALEAVIRQVFRKKAKHNLVQYSLAEC